MPTGNTTLLGLALPVEGELDGTWGDVVNDSITSLVDSAVAGTTTLSADADVTLSTTVLAANQARQAVILWTASNGATTRNITAPAQSKPYIVINAGTGSIVLRGAGPTTGVTIVSGEKCLAAWNGSDFVKVSSSTAGAGDVTLTGTQTLTNKTLDAVLLNDGYTEEVFAVTGTTPALSPTNGSIQTWTLSGNSTPTAGTWASGQSLTLMVDDDTAYTIDWSSVAVTWKTNGGTAPTLNTTGFTAIQLWKVDTVIYGARVGDA
jgi:hypothetical protein